MMSSKTSKPDKSKLKFAQSNINHVYKGNASETQHKPAVRQYGMQVVGKLQGTRRLPPPAWVPSIKAETGGLDSRISIVPQGGSGWGAPTSTESASISDGISVELHTSAPITIPAMNGSMSRETMESTFEPVYARSNFTGAATSASSTNGVSIPRTLQEPLATEKGSVDASSSLTESTSSTATSKSSTWAAQCQAAVASGGLAANKPFFQRPAPVASTTPSSQVREDTQNPPVAKPNGGASEILGEPSGWAAVDEQEPNFDEQILFSDDEESQTSRDTMSRMSSERKTVVHVGAPPTGNFHTAVANSAYEDSVRSGGTVSSAVERASAFVSVPSSMYDDAPSRVIPDVWSSSDGLFSGPTNRPLLQSPNNKFIDRLPMGSGPGMTERVGPPEQYILHPTSQHGFPVHTNSFYPNPVSSRINASPADSTMLVTDMDTEMQHAQRQARTQEFKSAVERAQLARLPRQKPDVCDTHRNASMSIGVENTMGGFGPANTPHHAGHIGTSQSSDQPLMGNVLPSQLLMSSAYQQATNQNRADLAAAAVAAAAVAMAWNGGGVPNTGTLAPPVGTTTFSKGYQSSQHQIPLSSQSAGGQNSWSASYAPPSSSTAVGLQSSAAMQSHTSQQQKQHASTVNSNEVASRGSQPVKNYLSPDCLIERFLEIFNEQSALPQLDQRMLSGTSGIATSMCSTVDEANTHKDPTSQDTLKTKPHHDTVVSKFDNTTSDPALNSDALSSDRRMPLSKTDSQVDRKTSTNDPPGKTDSKRVPGLMDVEVSTSSCNLALRWAQSGYLTQENRGSRGRSKLTPEKSTTSSKTGRPGRYPTDDYKNGRNRTTTNMDFDPRDSGSHPKTWKSKNVHSTSRTRSDGNPDNVDIGMRQSSSRGDPSGRERVPPPVETEFDASGQGDLMDISEETFTETGEKTEYYQPKDTSYPRRAAYDSTSKQRHMTLPEPSDMGEYEGNQGEFNRRFERGRRGRGNSGFNYSTSRTFSNEDPATQMGRGKHYPRTSRGGSFTTRSMRVVVNPNYSSDSRRRYVDETQSRGSDRNYRAGHDNRGSDRLSGAFPGSSTARWSNREYQPSKHPRPQTGDDYYYEERCSDGEQGHAEYNQGRARQVPRPRNRSHEGTRHTTKPSGSRKTGTDEYDRRKDRQQVNAAPRDDNHQDADNFSQLDLTSVIEDFSADTDIPTVRVPAVDTSYKPRSRGGGRLTFPRGSAGSRRGNSSNPNVVQNKRATGASVQGTRKYRDLPDRNRDGKDGDGGAAAGGAGRSSNAHGGGSSAANTTGGGSNVNGRTDTGGQKSGGNRDSDPPAITEATPSCESKIEEVVEEEDHADEINTNNERNRNRRQVQTYRQDRSFQGHLSDTNDAEEWETATEGSTEPESVSSSSISPTITTSHPSMLSTHAEFSDKRNSRPVECLLLSNNLSADTTILGDDTHIATTGTSAAATTTSGAPITSVSTTLPRPTTTTARGRMVCQVSCGPSDLSHIRRDGGSDGGSGAGDGTGYTGQYNTGAHSSEYSRADQRRSMISNDRRSNTGSRYQSKFARENSNRKVFSKQRLNTASIPSLMSIKPENTLNRTSTMDDESNQLTTNTKLTVDSPKDEAHVIDDDNESQLSDGFTKVASKASKRLARKRMQLETQGNSQPVRNAVDGTKPRASAKSNVSSISYQNVTKQSVGGGTQFKSPRAPKPLSQRKPTFMGPPLNMSQASTSSTNCKTSTTGPVNCAPKAWTTSMSQSQTLSSVNTRTWSKVVGSKPTATPTTPVATNDGPENQSPDWSAPNACTKTRSNDMENEAKVPNSLPAKSPDTSAQSMEPEVSSAYKSVQGLWSSAGKTVLKETAAPEKVTALSSSEQTHAVVTISPSVGAAETSEVADSSSCTVLTNSAISNVCKVRPQQQLTQHQVSSQSPPQAATNSLLSNPPLSLTMNHSIDHTPTMVQCTGNSLADTEQLASEFESLCRPHTGLRAPALDDSTYSASNIINYPMHNWTANSHYYANRNGQVPSNLVGLHNGSWPSADQLLDIGATRVAPINDVAQSYTHLHTSDVLSNLFTNTTANSSAQSYHTNKTSQTVAPRSYSYNTQAYTQPTAAAAVSTNELHLPAQTAEFTKLSTTAQSHGTTYPSMGGGASTMYMPQQQVNTLHSQPQSYPVNWSAPTAQRSLSVSQSQRGGQRVQRQIEPSPFGGFSYHAANIQPYNGSHAPRANVHSLINHRTGLYSSYEMPPPPNQPTPPLTSQMAYANNYSVESTGAPTPPVPYHHPNTQAHTFSTVSAQNLAHAQSTQNQQQFQVFYPSLSPSNQRIHSQQPYTASHNTRSNVHSLMNPRSGLYGNFEVPPPQNQPTPPLHSQMAYANNFHVESTVAQPASYHSNAQTYSTVGLQQHIHAHRPSQSSAPRNLGTVANRNAASPLMMLRAVGPTGVPTLSGYAQPSVPISISGYPMKPVLPTL